VTCRQWVDEGHIACDAWADEFSASCVSWRDEGTSQCQQWADEGSNQCSSWADEGQNECQSKYYNNCHWYSPWNCVAGWFCSAWYWVANWVCQAWYWVANWVCQAWYWVANWVCQAFAFVVTTVCLIWSWVAKLVCVAWDWIPCLFRNWFGRTTRNRSPIKHIFVLMLENRSFDHILGFSAITGTDIDTGAVRTIDGASGSNQFEGTTYPPTTEADFKLSKPDVDPGHEFLDALLALCGEGATYPVGGGPYPPINNSGFIANYARSKGGPPQPPNIMKCYSPQRVPVITSLAKEFAVCDAWFSSLPGPTWPNRFFMHAASSGGLDHSPSGLSSAGNTLFDGYTFNNGTIFDRLDDACMEWRVFAGDSFPVTLALSGMTLNELQGRIHDFDEFAEAVSDEDYSAAYTFIEPNYGNDLPPSAEDFTCGNSQHPLDDITRGEGLIKSVYETIRNSPHWNESLLLVTYDEHGGFYDHAVPPGSGGESVHHQAATPPGDGVSDQDNVKYHFGFDQLGVRVPAIVVSPYIEKNIVDGTVYDHTSLLATVEAIFGLRPLTSRDANAENLTKLLARSTPRSDARLTLDPPAASGFRCDDDPTTDGSEPSIPALVGAETAPQDERQEYDWTDDNRPAESTLRGFQEIALLKALKNARGRDRTQIRREYFAAVTRGGSKYFIHKVALMMNAHRTPVVRSKISSVIALFRQPPTRPWNADSTSIYPPLDGS
jgi:phospholipase C